MLRAIRGLFAHLLIAVVAVLSVSAPAKAQIWYGSWDPLFGNPFLTPPFGINLGWGGGQGGTFFNTSVDTTGCSLPIGGGTISNSADCFPANSAKITSLQVRLYDFDVGQTPFLYTLVFNPNSLSIDQLRFGADGQLKGITTPNWSNWVQDLGAGTGAEFAIQFVLDGEPCLFCGGGNFPSLDSDYDGPVLFARFELKDGCPENQVCYEDGDGFYQVFRSNVNEYPAAITFVPEPASLALLAGSLLGFGVAQRRRPARK